MIVVCDLYYKSSIFAGKITNAMKIKVITGLIFFWLRCLFLPGVRLTLLRSRLSTGRSNRLS